MLYIEGFLLGIGTIIFIGPVFFYLLKTTLEKGTQYGIIVALGIIVSDIACVAICFTGARSFFKEETNHFWIAIIGGLILLALGLKYIIKPTTQTDSTKKLGSNKLAVFTQGFLVNFVNPFVFMVWIGFLVYGESQTTNSTSLLLFVFAILLGIFTTDLIKIFLANKIRSYLKPKNMLLMHRIIGAILILFSIRLLFFAY
ncbi:MAG: LysE family translocator [Vicingaceae bacterium]